MQADVACLRDQVRQRHQRVARRGRHELVVVHEHEQVRAAPPRAVPQLVRCEVRRRQAFHQRAVHVLDQLCRGRRTTRRNRCGARSRPRPAGHAGSRGRSDGPRPACTSATSESAMTRSRFDLPHSLSPNTTKCGSVSKSSSTGARVSSSMPIGTRRPVSCRDGSERQRQRGGQHADLRRGRAVPGAAHRLDHLLHAIGQVLDAGPAVDARQRGQEVQPLARDAAAWTSLRHVGRHLPVELRLVRVAEPQLQP